MSRRSEEKGQGHVDVLIIYPMTQFMKYGIHPLVVVFHVANHPNIARTVDVGAKSMLVAELERLGVSNVELLHPMSRNELLEQYNNSDFLFLHLNDYEAFEKVLPSKIFELATFNKPVVAGVGGYANRFIYENVDNVILFQPCDVDSMVAKMKNYEYKNVERQEFIRKFSRDNINQEMARSILSYL